MKNRGVVTMGGGVFLYVLLEMPRDFVTQFLRYGSNEFGRLGCFPANFVAPYSPSNDKSNVAAACAGGTLITCMRHFLDGEGGEADFARFLADECIDVMPGRLPGLWASYDLDGDAKGLLMPRDYSALLNDMRWTLPMIADDVMRDAIMDAELRCVETVSVFVTILAFINISVIL